MSPIIAGDTLERKQEWCLNRIETNLQNDITLKINFSNFIEALVRISEHTCRTDQNLSDKIIGFIEKTENRCKKSLVFANKFYIHEENVRTVIKKYSPVLIRVYEKELEERLINTESEDEKHTVMNFRILLILLKKWGFVNEDVKAYRNCEEKDLYNEDRNISPLIKDRESIEVCEVKLRYSNVVEIFYASLKHKNFLYFERSLRKEGIGLSIYEFIDFIALLGIYMWRTNLNYKDLKPEEALSKTFKMVGILFNFIIRNKLLCRLRFPL